MYMNDPESFLKTENQRRLLLRDFFIVKAAASFFELLQKDAANMQKNPRNMYVKYISIIVLLDNKWYNY